MANNLLNNLKRNRSLRALNKATATTAATPVVEDRTLQTWIKTVDSAIKSVISHGVSKNDLVDYGVLEFGSNGNLESLIGKDKDTDLTVPLMVENLNANGAYSSVTLDWDTPKNKSFGYNAVYRSETNDFGTAAQIGSTLGDVYTDYVGNGVKAFYWVRTISKYGVEGQISSFVFAESSMNIPYVLDKLRDKITSSQFTQSLREDFESIKAFNVDIKEIVDVEIGERLKLAQEMALNFFNLQAELTDNASQNSAAISNVQTVLNNKIENVAQEIALVSAGVGEQFDTYKIWFFDEDTSEGWTSLGGEPEVQNGWIRAFLNGANTAYISPPNISFSGTAYPDIRFRVKKVGHPVWNATLAWGNDYAVYVNLAEPIWNESSGIATVQKNVDWIGNIGQIKLSLSDSIQDENNYFVIDWFTFGRPSPAASWAAIGEIKTAIATETQARTSYQNSNEAKLISNDNIYRGLIQSAADIAASETGVVAHRLDSFVAENTTMYAGSLDDYAGSPNIFVGHTTEEMLRIEGDAALYDEIEIRAIQIGDSTAAAIQEEAKLRADADSATIQTLNTMQTKISNDLGELSAAIQSEATARTDADGAMAESINTMQAKIDDDISAAIQEESKVRAEADSAMAESLNTMQAKIDNDISAAIQEESRVRADADGVMAESIKTLETKVGAGVNAAIQQEAKVRADADTAMAKTISTVQTTVNGHTSSIQETKTAINGINAEWKLRVRSGNKISGISVGNNGTESAFTVLADRFAIVQATGTVVTTPFVVESSKVYINTAVIKDASITAAKIGNLSADKITTGNIAADRMKANALTAVKANLQSLSAISATIGTLRTKTSGARTEIKDNLIEVYDASGQVRVRLGVW